VETPLDFAPNLSARTGNTVLLKREDMQPVFSFKLRGAYNKMAHLSARRLKRGVICASAGNHAQGVALSASEARLPGGDRDADDDAADQGRRGARRGGEVVLAGDSYDDAYAHALELEKAEKLTFVHPFDDPDVIAGRAPSAWRSCASIRKPIHADLLLRRRRRPDRRCRGLHQAPAPGDQDHRRRAVDADAMAVAGGRQARAL
jgi:threonine dehydratase